MRHTIPVLASVVALSTAFLAGGSAVGADRAPTPHRGTTPTHFALAGSGFGTRVTGGRLPTASSATAFEIIGCTNLAGREKRAYEAQVTVPGVGVLHGLTTRLYTEKKGDTVSSYSTHSIARLDIGSPSFGMLEIKGLESVSRAFNNSGRFGGQFSASIASITFAAAGSPPQNLRIPTPNRPLTIPGLATISIAKISKNISSTQAHVRGAVVDIHVIPTDTVAKVAQTNAIIGGGVKRGVFKGFSAGLRATSLADNARIGRTPVSIMPCPGTFGVEKKHALARVGAGSQLLARGVASSQVSTNTMARATGTERGSVAKVSLAKGRVQITGIEGVANVTRTAQGVTSNSDGSHVLDVVIDGKHYSFPKLGKIEIPGLVKLQDDVEEKLNNGLRVIGLRATLLDGTGAVVDLGVAQLQVRPGAL